jgi:peptidoglycan/LPS O-acetylase OafA/YrhL
MRFRPDIEGLRALAVIFVVLYHAKAPFLRQGLIGVDIFFVLSGYLITGLLSTEMNSTGEIDLVRFYARRARRLLPAAVLVVLTICLAEAILASPLAQFNVLKAALATTLYSSNIYYAHAHVDYFSWNPGVSPFAHTWSLGVEEQFYLVWPILLLLLTRVSKSIKVRVAVVAAITLASFAGCVWLTRIDHIQALFQSPARVWEFGVGALAGFVPIEWIARHARLCGYAAMAGLVTLILSAAFLPISLGFPGYVVGVPVIATAALLQACAVAPDSRAANLLSLRPFQFLGRISYPLYLWHWPILSIAKEAFQNNSWQLRAGCIALAVLLSAETHVLVENPIRFRPSLMSRPKLTLGGAALLMTLCVGGLMGWRAMLLHSVQYRRYSRVVADMPSIYASGCSADDRPRMCILGDTSNPVSTVVLFGDSHAAQWFQPLNDIAIAEHWKLITIVKVACSPMSIRTSHLGPAQSRGCDQWRERAFGVIQQLHPDMVVLSSSSRYPRPGTLTDLLDSSEWEQASRRTFLALARPGTSVKFIRDTPYSDYDVPSCLAQRAWNGRASCYAFPRSRVLTSDIFDAESRAATNAGNVQLIDMSDTICHGDSCEPEQGGLVVLRDQDHLTETYAASLAGELRKRLMSDSN